MKKKIITSILLSALVANLFIPSNASASTFGVKPVDTMSKSEFAAYIDSMPIVYSNYEYTEEEKTATLSEYILDGFSEEEVIKLEEMGIYLYSYETNTESETNKTRAYGTTAQVDQETPAISYDSTNKEWIVVAGGKWNNISWVPDSNGNIGGHEIVGFTFNNSNAKSLATSKFPEYTSLTGSLISTTASSDSYSLSKRQVVNYDDYLGEERNGLACQLQDKSLKNSSASYGHYVGENFAIVARYDSRFANITGTIRGFYIHTGVSCDISSFTLGGDSSGTITVSATYAHSNRGIKDYSKYILLWSVVGLSLDLAVIIYQLCKRRVENKSNKIILNIAIFVLFFIIGVICTNFMLWKLIDIYSNGILLQG